MRKFSTAAVDVWKFSKATTTTTTVGNIWKFVCNFVYFCVFYLWLLICITSAARWSFFWPTRRLQLAKLASQFWPLCLIKQKNNPSRPDGPQCQSQQQKPQQNRRWKKSATRNAFWKLTGSKVDPNLKSKLELPIQNTQLHIPYITPYIYSIHLMYLPRLFSHWFFQQRKNLFVYAAPDCFIAHLPPRPLGAVAPAPANEAAPPPSVCVCVWVCAHSLVATSASAAGSWVATSACSLLFIFGSFGYLANSFFMLLQHLLCLVFQLYLA